MLRFKKNPKAKFQFYKVRLEQNGLEELQEHIEYFNSIK